MLVLVLVLLWVALVCWCCCVVERSVCRVVAASVVLLLILLLLKLASALALSCFVLAVWPLPRLRCAGPVAQRTWLDHSVYSEQGLCVWLLPLGPNLCFDLSVISIIVM